MVFYLRAKGNKMLHLPENVLAWSELVCQKGVAEFCGYLWQPAQHAAILGISQKAEAELNMQAIADSGVKVIRRQSGGGAVILCDNVLCFGFFAPAGDISRDLTIRESFEILTRPVVSACEKTFGIRPVIAGISDLAVEYKGELKKICGCAQMRKRGAVLVHGTILVNADLSLLEKYLAWPSEVPDYRKKRSHTDFCVNLTSAASKQGKITDLAAEIKNESDNAGWKWLTIPDAPDSQTAELVRQKYANPRWNILRERPKG